MKYRIQYGKRDEAKYVSHLDMVRLFGRAFSRAGYPPAYSEGFNPHPKLSFGPPLPVGLASDGEYLDAELLEGIGDPEEFRRRMSAALPKGVFIGTVRETDEADRRRAPACAEYSVSAECTRITDEEIDALLRREEGIRMEKRTKSGSKVVDIRPYIKEARVSPRQEGGASFYFLLSAGNEFNLKPELVLDAMETYLDGFRIFRREITRLSFRDRNGDRMNEKGKIFVAKCGKKRYNETCGHEN